jgi:methionyl-tRNA formyltransferase
LCITAAYGQYLPKRFLATPTYGTVNIHPSLLPKWRGASPVQRSLEAGDNPVGVTVLFTISKMDAGPIIAQEEQMIDENDQATTVLPLLFEMGTNMLLEVLPDILEGKITMETAQPQDESLVVNANMIDASEAELRVWQESARVCHNRVRGFSMWPGTFCYLQIGDEEQEPTKVKIAKTRVLEESAEPTDVIEIGPNKGDGLRLVCGDGSILEVLELQPVTRKVMDAKSFVNGLQGRSVRWVKTPAVPVEA